MELDTYFLSAGRAATVDGEWEAGLWGVGAVVFKTKVLYTWTWSRSAGTEVGFRLCNAVLMTGIHGQCQVQVGMWMLVGA